MIFSNSELDLCRGSDSARASLANQELVSDTLDAAAAAAAAVKLRRSRNSINKITDWGKFSFSSLWFWDVGERARLEFPFNAKPLAVKERRPWVKIRMSRLIVALTGCSDQWIKLSKNHSGLNVASFKR